MPRVGVDALENSFIVKSSRLWNNLPDKLWLISIIYCFKSALKTMYLERNKEACWLYYSSLFITFHIILICTYDVIYEADIALCNIKKLPLQL